MISAPAFLTSFTYLPGSSTIIWTSNTRSVVFLRDEITGIPKEMLGTNAPSITSRWMYCAPASETVFTSSPSFEKSAERIDGANIYMILISPFTLQFFIDQSVIFIPGIRNLSCFYGLLDAALPFSHMDTAQKPAFRLVGLKFRKEIL